MKRHLCITLVALGMVAGIRSSAAQPVGFGRLEGLQTNAAVFTFARPGDATKRVYLWGAVQRPGLYEVEASTGFSALLSLAGGPVLPIRSDELVQRVSLRLYRMSGETRQLAFEASVDSLLQQVLPLPQEDDVIEVRVDQKRIRRREVLPYITAGASVLGVLTSVLTILLR